MSNIPVLSIFSMPANVYWQANEMRNSHNPHSYRAREFFTHGEVRIVGNQWSVTIDDEKIATFALPYLADAVRFMSSTVVEIGKRERIAHENMH